MISPSTKELLARAGIIFAGALISIFNKGIIWHVCLGALKRECLISPSTKELLSRAGIIFVGAVISIFNKGIIWHVCLGELKLLKAGS